jgi:hypothetical protein
MQKGQGQGQGQGKGKRQTQKAKGKRKRKRKRKRKGKGKGGRRVSDSDPALIVVNGLELICRFRLFILFYISVSLSAY